MNYDIIIKFLDNFNNILKYNYLTYNTVGGFRRCFS